MILTDEEIMDVNQNHEFDSAIGFARAIEYAVIEKIRKQLLEEVCFKMASGSPNRARIHKVIDSWKLNLVGLTIED